MTDDSDLITDHVVSTAERLEAIEDVTDFDPLEYYFEVDEIGYVKATYAILTMGGPYIEANLTNQTVYGTWGSARHTTHFSNELLKDHGWERAERFEERID